MPLDRGMKSKVIHQNSVRLVCGDSPLKGLIKNE